MDNRRCYSHSDGQMSGNIEDYNGHNHHSGNRYHSRNLDTVQALRGYGDMLPVSIGGNYSGSHSEVQSRRSGGYNDENREFDDVVNSLHISISDLNIERHDWGHYESGHHESGGSNYSGSRSSSPHSLGSRDFDRKNSPIPDAVLQSLDKADSYPDPRPIGSRSQHNHFLDGVMRMNDMVDRVSYGHHSPVASDDDDYGYRSGGSLGSNSSYGSGPSGGAYGGDPHRRASRGSSFGSVHSGSNLSNSHHGSHHSGNSSSPNPDAGSYEPRQYHRYGTSGGEISSDYLGYIPRLDSESLYQSYQHQRRPAPPLRPVASTRMHGDPMLPYHGVAHGTRQASEYPPAPIPDDVLYYRQSLQQHQGHHSLRANSASPSTAGSGSGVPLYRQQQHQHRLSSTPQSVVSNRPPAAHSRPIHHPDPAHYRGTMPTYGPSGQGGYAGNRGSSSRGSTAELRRDFDLEVAIYRNAQSILSETANKCLKSVELANALRDRIGKDALQRTKNLYGGLLVLLELYKETFVVHRIPKNDMVELIAPLGPALAADAMVSEAHVAPKYSRHITATPIMSQLTNRDRPHSAAPSAPASKCLFINEIPENVSGTQIWNDFGGQDIVQKVSIEFQGSKKTGTVVFTSVNAAKAAWVSPALAAWKHVLSFSEHGTENSEEQHKATTGGDPSLVSTGGNHTEAVSDRDHDSDELARMLVSVGNSTESSPPEHEAKAPAIDNSGDMSDISGSSSSEGPEIFDDAVVKTGSSDSSGGDGTLDDPPTPPGLAVSCDDKPSLTLRRVAPPPINTTAEVITSESMDVPSPSALLSPALSTPGGTPRLSFSFFDESSDAGITTLSGVTLPQEVCDVMTRLCDTLYVPQRTWERNDIGDYLFCQVLTEILSTQFGGNFIQMTKLKQQLKRKFGGSIRIGPLKALIVAYPEYFEVDRNVTVVRSLNSVLPTLDISVITNT